MIRPVSFLSGVLATGILVGQCTAYSLPAVAIAKPAPKEWVKYLNPIPQKNYSVNKAQDRAIKKKGFKTLTVAGARPVQNDELGVFATIKYADINNGEMLDKLLADPILDGVAITLPWKDLEPGDDKYDWSKIDKILEAAKAKNKFVIIRVSSAGIDNTAESDTPDWVFEAGAKSLTFKDTEGKEHKAPVFWDSVYLPQWAHFIEEMGKKYDGNKTIHSIGITGGGIQGRTLVVPELSEPLDKVAYKATEDKLKTEHGMSQRQLVEHWKYVADIFPKAFKQTRLNFYIDPPTPNRAGQDSLDEISDYIIYRYGQRVFLTRMSINNAKHGFDQYRVLLKFHNDTFTGYQFTENMNAAAWAAMPKFAADDGVSFVEVPAKVVIEKDEAAMAALAKIREHLGYQLVAQKVQLPEAVTAGDSFKASFVFANLGAATAARPQRELDRDINSSYKVQFELQDQNGKPRAILLHTPEPPTHLWRAGKEIAWDGDIKTSKQLKPGKYKVVFSLIDADAKRKIDVLNATGEKSSAPEPQSEIVLGDLTVQ